jgi:mannose-6-phosphate isomerase-like protein (cupin superfamily)
MTSASSRCAAPAARRPGAHRLRGVTESLHPSDYAIARAADARDAYAGSPVPGEFRSMTGDLAAEQLAVTFIHVPPHADFEQGTGHFHDEVEELYIVTRGTLTMRLGDDVRTVEAGSVVRVAPAIPRSHRNEGDEPVEMWAVSRRIEHGDAHKLDGFWEASPHAAQSRDDAG